MKKLFIQMIRFGIVGALAFCVDYGLLLLFTEVFGIYYLASSMMSFVFSVIFNYILSMKFVFTRKKESSAKKEFLIFLILSVIGLGINQLVMWFMVEKMEVFYAITKIFATGIVMVWNFISRKLLIEGKEQATQTV